MRCRVLGAAVMAAMVSGLPAAVGAQRPAPPAMSLGDLSRSLQDLSGRVGASVVQIFVTGYTPPDDRGGHDGLPALQRTSGSGVIVDPAGYIVTNAHVVEHATRIEVQLPLAATGGDPGHSILGGRGRLLGAQIVALDRETDLAVIKVEATALPALAFGDSDALRPGQLVLAFGSPLGFESSVTLGIVSAVARQLAPEDPMIYVQTDAPINPGNSGGALVDAEGRLVGINTLIYSRSGGSDGIGFAAPSNIVRNVFEQIRKHGRVQRGEIGVITQTITGTLAEALALAVDSGVIVADVAEGGPAAWAGVRPGDVILALDGKRMENGRQFRINVYTRGAGQQVSLDIQRGESRLAIRVPVIERHTDTSRLTDLLTPQNSIRALGIVGLDLNPQIARMLPALRSRSGVVVASVSPDTFFSAQGRLQAGDVIHAVNGRPIEGIADLAAAAERLEPGAAAVLHVERDGTMIYLAFRAESR